MSNAPVAIKICGVTDPADATLATQAGADFIGMIFAKHSKRLVTASQAKEIASAAQSNGAKAVGVFVEQNAQEIMELYDHAGLSIVQLHGDIARSAFDLLPTDVNKILVVEIKHDHSHHPENYLEILAGSTASLLFDYHGGGSGKQFDWTEFKFPTQIPWILAGGLNPDNVSAAMQLNPAVVDVASGVADPQTNRIDPQRLQQFIDAVQKANKQQR